MGLAEIAACEGIESAACADEERKPAKSTSARKRSEVSCLDIFCFVWEFRFLERNRQKLERVRKESQKDTFLRMQKRRER